MMSNNLATNLHLMVSIWKFETKLLTWETFQREMNPIGQLLWKNLKPHISKLLNLLSFCLFFSNVALHCCKHFEIVPYCWYVWLSIHQFIQISKFVWSNFSWCLSPWLVLYSPLFQPLVCYIFTDYLSNWLNVPGWSRMNYCKNTEKIQCLSSIHSLFQPGLAQNCTFDQVQYELVLKPWTDPNLISYLVLVCNIWWSFSPGLVQFELVLNPWSGPM